MVGEHEKEGREECRKRRRYKRVPAENGSGERGRKLLESFRVFTACISPMQCKQL
ncbi:hypothetical protein GCM10023261_16670 [Bartonella jaculi]|uniref:Uncharacterized protein n=1 Tax=Bartonella jaculi TaxID=686226 RepID=A0ABP9N906_9HYPH